MVKTIEVDTREEKILKRILYSELHTFRDRQAHAQSRGDVYMSPEYEDLQFLVDKLENAVAE